MESPEDFEFEFVYALDSLARCGEKFNKKLAPLLKLKNWSSKEKQSLLQILAEFMLNEDAALLITKYFKPVILEILQRCAENIKKDEKTFYSNHESFSFVLSSLLPVIPNIQGFILEYFNKMPPFYIHLREQKSRFLQNDEALLMVIRTAYNFLNYNFETFIDIWNWSTFFEYLQHCNTRVRWLSAQLVAMVTQMSETNKLDLIGELFTVEDRNKLMLEMAKDCNIGCIQTDLDDLNSNNLTEKFIVDAMESDDRSVTGACFTKEDFTGNHITISGVVLHTLQRPSPLIVRDLQSLVMIPSTKRNIHSLALAVATGSGVLLEGPVGSGKTSLVENLARMTGRTSAPSLMKVQLGDQTDSKSLLGTYICTETPGEFVWQAGTLLQAIQGGHWVLLEDIDYAPMDVVSVLIPLLESRTLSVPGHGNVVKAAPGFQLFATQRTHSHSGFAFHAYTNSSILDRLWTRVNIELPSQEELIEIICQKFPDMSSISPKLVDIYCMVSSDTKLTSKQDTSLSSLSLDKRLSTTRDLMKWTSRVSMATSNGPFFAEAKDVFLEAQDCFGATLTKAEHRLELGMIVGAKLGIAKEKVEFFLNNYKPKVHMSPLSLAVGRVSLNRQLQNKYTTKQVIPKFAHTRHSLVLLERVAACIKQEEPVLLVGETGTGKTSSVQNLAALCGYNLKVINMSQQSDSADLLGGFKPVEMKQLVGPVREYFEKLFCQTFSRKQNIKYLSHIQQSYAKSQWEILFKLMIHSQKAAVDRINKGKDVADHDISTEALLNKWQKFSCKIDHLRKQQKHAESALAFRFVEGTLVKAIRDGDWILLDEINLATPETLECLSGLLESSAGSVVLLERGDVEPIIRHDNFRLFACMNPATDVGKKDLPPGIRNRFTEIFVDELEDVNDLKTLVIDYLQGLSPSAAIVDGIVRFYLTARHEASDKLTDGTGHKPHYSLRTLCRALRYASSNPHGNTLRSIYEGFCLSFLTQLDRSSHPVVESLIRTNVLGHVNATSLLNQPLPCPNEDKFVNFEGFWINVGEREPIVPTHYVLTPAVKANLRDLARVVSGRSFPVLIQGETSVGKTSLVQWLASASGNQCVRINNHEHTDIQEYLGCYTSDPNGRLVFKEGVLVDAMRKGYWIILDELNLAPTDVLEALNRLLDDNRELFIAETQDTVKAHPNFMLYATQNPPGQYGGRKVLSRAFRNRFVELHFDELPSNELEKILHQRGSIPMSYAKKMVAVLLDLQARRRSSSVFAGKQGFITLRDLFRWAERYSKNPDAEGGFHDWEQHIAGDGYMLLAGRCRNPEECKVIQEVLEIHFKRKLDPQILFSGNASLSKTPLSASDILDQAIGQALDGFDHIVWTKNMKRLAVLVGRALQFSEPVLLVGETGCGKTTICQLFSALKRQQLYSVNCHMHSESTDFLGGLRPVRSRHLEEEDGKLQKFFEWCDGPLVLAMKEGATFLVDEISLADDSVLERLNSVLEPERTLVLAEKGTEGGGMNDKDVDIIVAHEAFRVVATMNPGGDFGKKELSPALRNRFTEIWCPSTNNDEDLIEIIEHNLKPGLSFKTTPDGSSGIGEAMAKFVNWFHLTEFGRRFVVSIRDLLSWVRFINTCCSLTPYGDHVISDHVTSDQSPTLPALPPAIAYLHGACLVFLDALGAGLSSLTSTSVSPQEARSLCIDFLRDQVQAYWENNTEDFDTKGPSAVITDNLFGIKPFYITRGSLPVPIDMSSSYALNAPTTSQNAQRLLRALQLERPILLEGSPGVGKTSLVTAIAKASGHELVRINLSEQTDITDLFGADLPVEGGEPGMFSWRDGPLLRALKAGHWIVLDELNLASQSVLEGLNACLDHRAEVYIPELGMTFKVQHEKTRLFACQNPLNQGGGRKGLPKSFLNRFTQVYVEPLSMEDLLFITTSLYPNMDYHVLQNMIRFNMQLHQETVVEAAWGKKGSPWEFNLRDVFRWCDLLLKHKTSCNKDLLHFAKLIYSDRMRTTEDKIRVAELLYKTFDENQLNSDDNLTYKPTIHVTPLHVQVGYSFLPRDQCANRSGSLVRPLQVLHHDLPYIESLMKCIDMNWMTILVGPRSCGKTSLVQLLAELTGTKLDVMAMNSAMDTTELLGGFEQANLNRHWEDIISESRRLVTSTVRTALLRKKPNGTSMECGSPDPCLLYSQWESFIKPETCEEDESRDNSSRLTVIKIDQLVHVLHNAASLSRQSCCNDIDTVKERALDLKKRLLSNNGSTHCGGQFEWVDGQLVQALKSGHWLLIDNVNFCSPSVLDRLNALLEPGGVLSINERGVIDGEVPAVKPHPEFRLILTMDPRFGEISRAMRNRGVEIYMSGEDGEMTGYDSYDLQVMLNGAGLHHAPTCQTLLAFQQEYKAKLGGSVLDLLHAATMVTDLMHRGEDLRTALMTSLNQVYVRSHVNETEKQIAEDLVITHTKQKSVLQRESCSLLVDSCPSVRDFIDDSTLATIRWHCMPLIQLLWKQQSTSQHIEHAIDLVIERSSLCDWQLRCEFLSSVVEKMGTDPVKEKEIPPLVAMVRSVVQELFSSSLMRGVKESYSLLAVERVEMDVLSHQPYDLRLAGQLCHRIDSLKAFQHDTRTDSLLQITSLANRLHLLAIRLKQVVFEKTNENSSSHKSLAKLSRDLHAGLVSMEMLPHPSVAHLMPFFKYFNAFVHQLILTNCSLSDDGLMEALESLQWSTRLFNTCTSLTNKRFSLALLSLHWQWFVEKTLRVFPQLVGQHVSECPRDLMTVIRQLSHYLGTDTQLAKAHLEIVSDFGHPLPFKSESVYHCWEKFMKLCHVFELSWRQNMTSVEELRLTNQVKLISSEGQTIRDMLSRAIVHVFNEKSVTHDGMLSESVEVEELVEKITTIATNAGLVTKSTHAAPLVEDIDLRDDGDDDEVRIKVSSNNAMKMALFPLFDDVGSSQELFVVTELLRLVLQHRSSSFHDNVHQEMYDKLDSLIKFLLSHSTRSSHTLAIYRVYQAALLQNEAHLSIVIKNLDSELMQSLMTQRTRPLLSMNIAKWAMLSSRLTNQTLEAVDIKSTDIDSYIFNILDNQSSTKLMKEDDVNDPLSSVAIGNHKEKSDQLQVLVRHLWTNADHVTNQANQNRLNDINLFASKFSQVLLSLAALLDTSDVMEEVTQVAMAITQTDSSQLEGRLEEIVNKVFSSYEQRTGTTDNIDDMKKLLAHSYSHFKTCVDSLHSRGEGVQEDSFSMHSGCMWVNLGLLQTLILAPVGPVDPVEETAIELQYVRDEITEVKTELQVRFLAEELWTGSTINQNEIEKDLETGRDPSTLQLTSNPLRVKQLMCKLVKAKEREKCLMRNTAVRPKPSQFGSILSDVKHYTSTIGNTKAVFEMLSNLQQAFSSIGSCPQEGLQTSRQLDLNSVQNMIQRVGSWTNSQEKFMSQMKIDYPLYSDVTGPFLSSTAQILYGMTKISSSLQDLMQKNLFLIKCPNLDTSEVFLPRNLIDILCGHGLTFDKTSLQLANVLMSSPTWACIQGLKNCQPIQEENNIHSGLTSRLLWTSLLFVRNHTVQQGYLNGKAINALLEILDHYTQQWTLAKEEEQKREQEEGNLFKYKTRSHMEELDEEKEIQKSLCQSFPTFDSEFNEILPSSSLEEVTTKLEDIVKTDPSNSDVEKFMKNVDTSAISKIHKQLFCDITSCQSWMLIGSVTDDSLRCHSELDHLELLQTCYQTASVVSKMNEESECYQTIRECGWESHLVQSHAMLQRLTFTDEDNVNETSHKTSLDNSEKHYDIYHDTNIPEVIRVRPVMTTFNERLNELLAEWPGNPLLTQLQSFIDKILSLPVTSSVMRVLTGVELLLKNSQEWENNASRHVSIKENLDSIIQLIIRWRKLELRCWSCLLDVATDKASSKASQWWFYLYSLVQQVFSDDNTNQTSVEFSDLIDPLQRFIESSTLGEFSARLRMLFAFYHQCVTMETTIATRRNQGDPSTKVSDVLFNIYTYYNQFAGAVQNRLEQARNPIEKELKGYVKIAKWNDSNFWAMKQAAEKSHRTLHKFVRRYETALNEPVRQLLMNTKTILGSLEVDSIETPRDGNVHPDWFITSEQIQIPQQHAGITSDQFKIQTSASINQIERLPKLFSRMKKLCLSIIAQQKYSQLVTTLDEFTGEIITTAHELQSLDVSSQPKEKRSEMRKHIHIRKRTSLAELFKALSSLGLSYRKGLQTWNQSSIQDSSMLLPALDERVIFNIHAGMQSYLVKSVGYLGKRCQHYYYRCVARMSALNVHMVSPSKELTMGDIDRAKGYTHHLMRVVQNQRKAIATVTQSMALLRLASKSLSNVTEVDHESKVLPAQNDLPQQMVGLMDFLTWVRQVLLRSSHLLNSCPVQEFQQESTPFPTTVLSAVATTHRGSEMYQRIITAIQSCLSDVNKLTNDVRPHAVEFESRVNGSDVGNYVLASWKHVKVLFEGFHGLKTICQNIENILPYFKSSCQSDQGLGGPLHLLNQKINEECEKFQIWYCSLPRDTARGSTREGCDSTQGLTDTVEKTVTALLLGVQRISKITETRNDKNEQKQTKDQEEQDEEESLVDGHLVTHVYHNMTDDIAKLDLQVVQANVKSLISNLRESASTIQSNLSHGRDLERALISNVVPLLNQFIGLADSYLINMLSAHRTTCKLLSVLLGVFTELAEKGFCLPPEMEEEESGEGATEFEDIEDGGLGEGEGAKDVSDQIENEDQLQDAKQGQKEEKQDNNQQQIPEEENGIEMSEDFEGAMHDVEGEEQDDEKTGDEEEEEPDVDKQMGQLDGEEDEKLDEKMWGDSDDEDEKEEKESESEKGAGAEAETQSEMVAKEDNKDAVDQSREREQESNEQNEQNDNEENINELPKEDQGNLSDEELDEQGEGRDDIPDKEETNDLDLPEDLEFDNEVENQEDEEGKEEEKETNMEGGEEEAMDVDQDDSLHQDDEKEDEQGKEASELDKEADNEGQDKQDGGEEPKDDDVDDDEWRTKHESKVQDGVQALEDTTANDGAPQQNEVVEQSAGQNEPNDNREQHGVGSAEAVGSEGHSGEAEVTSAQSAADTKQKQRKQMNRSRSDRSLGSMDERTHKRLKTFDETEKESEKQSDVKRSSELYQHIKDNEESKHDAQTLDSATADQTQQQDGARFPENLSDDEEDEEDEDMEDSDMILKEKEERLQIQQEKKLAHTTDAEMKTQEEETQDEEKLDTSFQSRDMEVSADRTRSSYHVSNTALQQEREELSIDANKLRSDLEHQLSIWSNLNHGTTDEQRLAQSTWHKYEILTSSLAQELCEQLRLVLEPSLATKLKGDYRTGKRLNMRKVIPYIASQFRKDKIWLRRTKPSKRQYQVMIAVDDSSSMADNHSKQLAFESLAVISKALTRLEAGDLAVCSFGESVKLLHPLHEQFTDQSGAKILQQFTFDQTKTKIAQLVDTCSSLMVSSRSRIQSGPRVGSDTSQLLLVVSDGRGVFLEGMETVRRAVRKAKAAGIFLVFVIIDNPVNRDSILDIKVPIFRPGKLPEIKSYMDEFPFPFYVILRDINSLPVTLSDALRQWFELVTSMDT